MHKHKVCTNSSSKALNGLKIFIQGQVQLCLALMQDNLQFSWMEATAGQHQNVCERDYHHIAETSMLLYAATTLFWPKVHILSNLPIVNISFFTSQCRQIVLDICCPPMTVRYQFQYQVFGCIRDSEVGSNLLAHASHDLPNLEFSTILNTCSRPPDPSA